MLAALVRTYHTWHIIHLPWWVVLAIVLAAVAMFVFVVAWIRRHLAHCKPPRLPPANRTP
jgi:hypothetical protein